jgi:hypothetical protein
MKTLCPLSYRLLKEVQINAPAYLGGEEEVAASDMLIKEGRAKRTPCMCLIERADGRKVQEARWAMELTSAGLEAIKIWEQFGKLLGG